MHTLGYTILLIVGFLAAIYLYLALTKSTVELSWNGVKAFLVKIWPGRKFRMWLGGCIIFVAGEVMEDTHYITNNLPGYIGLIIFSLVMLCFGFWVMGYMEISASEKMDEKSPSENV